MCPSALNGYVRAGSGHAATKLCLRVSSRGQGQTATKLTREMGLVGETGRERDLSNRQAPSQQTLRASDAQLFEIRVRCETDVFAESSDQMEGAQSDLNGKLVKGELQRGVVMEQLNGSFNCCWSDITTLRDWHVSIALHQGA
jgi:hypothetical protein